jgi:hypothetical protein
VKRKRGRMRRVKGTQVEKKITRKQRKYVTKINTDDDISEFV